MKRGSPEGSHTLPDPKKSKDDKFAFVPELKLVQDKILKLDDECAAEQLRVQQQYAIKLRPLYAERQQVLKKIPRFWGRLIRDMISSSTAAEKDILMELEEVDVEDNLDDCGSYRITFTFNADSAKQYFTPSTLVKTVTFIQGQPGEPKVEFTPIIWTDGRNLLKEAEDKRKIISEDDDAGDELGFFEWFTNTEDYDSPPLGETLRREVWPNPLPHVFDFDDDESDDESSEREQVDDE